MFDSDIESKTQQVIMITLPNLLNNAFFLDSDFLSYYVNKQPSWNFEGYVTYKRTYARFLTDDSDETEEFWQTLKRVVEGSFGILKHHFHENNIQWDEKYWQSIAQDMYQRMWEFKMLPAGRGLWMMGTEFVEKHGSMSLNNCGYVTTENILTELSIPFVFAMDCLMQGVGVGSDTRGKDKIIIKQSKETIDIKVKDSRKGWYDALDVLLKSYFTGSPLPIFDYSLIRGKGTRIKGFGGVCEGYEPLANMIDSIKKLLENRIGSYLRSVDIMDIFCYIAKCVVSGNVRRSAILMLGDIDDNEFVDFKQDKQTLEDRRANSNNSVFGHQGMDYSKIVHGIVTRGDPNVVWLENAQKYSRMMDKPDWKDKEAKGVNPCFAGYEKLLTTEGLKTFEELDGKEVDIITPTNQIIKSKIWCSGEKETIKLTFGNWDTLTLTPDHILMTSDGREINAKDTLGERIRIHKEPFNQFDTTWVKYGFIQGDGQLTRLKSESHKGIEVNIGYKDDDIRDLFGIEEDGERKYYLDGFNDDLIYYGFHPDILPERTLPDNVPSDKINSFLRGLYSANGSVITCNAKNGRITLKSTCKKMIEQLKELLNIEFGIESYITTNKPKSVKFSNGEYLCKESYDLNILQINSIVIFYEKIGFVHKYKTKSLETLIYNRSPKVIKINEDEKQQVYDFSADPIHWGFVNGFLVHNCGEITLPSFSLCNLIETFPSNHNSYKDYERTLFLAYLYGKIVTLIPTQWEQTNKIMQKERRMGISQSGIMNAYKRFGRKTMLRACKKGYKYLRELDTQISNEWKIPESIKLTTVKPSGSVSLLAGVASGIHYSEAEYFIRRIRFANDSDQVPILKECGYPVEPDTYTKNSVVVSFPMKERDFYKSKTEVSMKQQIQNAVDYQRCWSDNQVSITVTFKKEEEKLLPKMLKYCETRLKGIAFLKLSEHGYVQAPFEAITKKQYEDMIKNIKPIPMLHTKEEGLGEMYCNNGQCEVGGMH